MKISHLLLFIALLLAACGAPESTTQPAIDSAVPSAADSITDNDEELEAEHEHDHSHEAENEATHNGSGEAGSGDVETEAPVTSAEMASDTWESIINLSYFTNATFTDDPQTVDCMLENGETAQCAQLTVEFRPEGLEIGPFCPETLDEVGGIWNWDGDNAGLYRLDNDFFIMVAEQGYTFFNEDGTINITDPGEPRVAGETTGETAGNRNSCLQASEDDTVIITMLIPLKPQMADNPTDLGTVAQVGVALDGVPIFADAPSVLQTGGLPALDPCGGHVDPGGWYHWHATSSDIDSSFAHEGVEDTHCHLEQSASALFGYGFDGYPIYGSTDMDGSIPTDLDACNGHVGETAEHADEIYHYHASLEFPNLPTCLSGVSAVGKFRTTAEQGIGATNGQQGRPGGGSNLATAAETLGISEEALRDALGGPPPDFDGAAEALGITVEELQEALGASP